MQAKSKKQKRLTLLLHPFRRDLYQVLCENPGTYLLELVSMLESPLGTLTWHLRILEREGLVKSIKFAGKRLYYPRMLRFSRSRNGIPDDAQRDRQKNILIHCEQPRVLSRTNG